MHTRSAARHADNNTDTNHVTREKVGEDWPGVGTSGGHARMSHQLPEPQSPSWHAVMHPRQSACPPLVGDAQMSRGAFRVMLPLAGDGQSLPHRLTARWLFAQRDTNSGPPAPEDLPPCNGARQVRA